MVLHGSSAKGPPGGSLTLCVMALSWEVTKPWRGELGGMWKPAIVAPAASSFLTSPSYCQAMMQHTAARTLGFICHWFTNSLYLLSTFRCSTVASEHGLRLPGPFPKVYRWVSFYPLGHWQERALIVSAGWESRHSYQLDRKHKSIARSLPGTLPLNAWVLLFCKVCFYCRVGVAHL